DPRFTSYFWKGLQKAWGTWLKFSTAFHAQTDEFQVGDRVFLKVSPIRGVKRFGIKGKLSNLFIGPFEILERIGEVSYRLALPPQLSHVHDVFHVSLLRGYYYHPLHVASYPFDQIQPDMSLSEEPESILDRQERVMRNKTIPFVKIIWKNHPEHEATWETKESMRASYPRDTIIIRCMSHLILLKIQPDMSLSEDPESILDRQERVMRNKTIPFVKILWKNHPECEATWRPKNLCELVIRVSFRDSVRFA
nr:hypothetical protein [Tanacetum cinerariifolium]